jgi:hypothetical protein
MPAGQGLSILAIWSLLGGKPAVFGHRYTAFWRKSTHPNIHLEGERWYDFAQAKGGGPIELVMHVTGKNFHEARLWLYEHGYAIDNPEYARKELQRAARWRKGLVRFLQHRLKVAKAQLQEYCFDPEKVPPALAQEIFDYTRRERQAATSWGQSLVDLEKSYRAADAPFAKRCLRDGTADDKFTERLGAAVCELLQKRSEQDERERKS